MQVPASIGVPGALSAVCTYGCTGTCTPTLNAGTGLYELKGIFPTYVDSGIAFIIFTVSGFTNPSSTTPATIVFESWENSNGADNAIDIISTLTI